MKVIATLLSSALAVATLIAAPAFAAEGDPLDAWKSALASSDTAQANVVYLGSSTTYGTGATTPEKRYVNVLTDTIRGSAESVNRAGASFPNRNAAAGVHGYLSAVGGTTSENYVNDTTRAFILWERPSLIVHMIGSNDSIDAEPYAVTPAEYEANVAAEVDRLNAGSQVPVSQVLVHTYRRSGVSVAKWNLYREALERVAATRNNVLVLDISGAYEQVDHLGADPSDLIGPDGVHQTDAGHTFMASLLAPALSASPAVEPEPAPTPAPVVTTAPAQSAPVASAPAPVEAKAPAQPRRVRAVRDGRRVKVTWRGVAGADSYEAKCGKRIVRVDGSRALVRSTAKRCSVRSVSDAGFSPWARVKVR